MKSFALQRDAQWWYKINGLSRHAIVRGALNPFTSPIVLTEYPKSGGTWLSQMLSSAMDIPYPRNRLPVLKSQIIHGCYLKVHPGIDTIVVWRDGRDTMVSYYYHIMFDKPITSAKFGKKLKKFLDVKDPHDIESVLPRFIDWSFNGGYPGYSWSKFVNQWIHKTDVIKTSYEKIAENPNRELKYILESFTNQSWHDDKISKIVAEYSFQNQTNRKPGEEDINSFIRKGVVGDWKNVFNKDARDVFNNYGGTELKLLGYEENDDWLN